MKLKIFKKNLEQFVLALMAIIMMAGSSFAVDLVAIGGQWSPDGGSTQIPMWGFVSDTGQACNSLPSWTVGPQLTQADLVGGNLTINLRNCLPDAVSIVIPGQPATFTPQSVTDVQGRTRIRAFTTEAVGGGGTATYTWSNPKAGTYLYQSGSQPAKQIQMGLYGALTIGTYPDTGADITLLYSEIDPVLHAPPTAATPLGYNPRYFLVNGKENQNRMSAKNITGPIVLRFLNAGLDFHVPALNEGSYMKLVAEDGNPYPFPREQYSVVLPAGRTIDALWQPTKNGRHVIYDRRLNGMYARLSVTMSTDVPAGVLRLK